ncbi:Type II/IV secretion system protein [Candidatus Gugararchaeum adminiculabundum]|nr:Type II/IV secretion system protein [Candidatus Gugararchaeum adminiculabundum]
MKKDARQGGIGFAIQDSYTVSEGTLTAKITIGKKEGEKIRSYIVDIPQWDEATEAFVEDIKTDLLRKITITSQEASNLKMSEELKDKFLAMGKKMVREGMPNIGDEKAELIARRINQEMLGLGDIEFFLRDDWIEEIAVNGAGQAVWIYHRKYGWMKTNITVDTENKIWNYASSIARGAGRQINTQSPLLDAYLSTGDRVNATLFPISYFGNTITIRKFARKPWTITDYIKTKTINAEVAALLWLAMQYEANVLVSGGTGAGKTSLLNVLSMFIPQNQRVISIEQTREITLPSHLQWVPLVVRQATSEAKGEIGMLDLMINSLRMRPDRIIVGEIRRAEEAQVLFEAMHTGHSVYATLHAETVAETVRRLTSPPINTPAVMMESLHLIITMYRDRKNNIRRVFEVGEIVPTDREGVTQRVLFRWRPFRDELVSSEQSVRLLAQIKTYTNMTDEEMKKDLEDKKRILEWMAKRNINSIDEVGKIISAYYDDAASVLRMIGKE